MPPGFARKLGFIPEHRFDLSGENVDPQWRAKENYERQVRAAMAAFFAAERERIKARVERKAPKSRKAQDLGLDKNFWAGEYDLLLAELLPILIDMSADALAEFQAEFEGAGIGVDWSAPNTAAVEWARRYAAQLVTGITANTRKDMARTVAAWLGTPGSPIGDLFERLEKRYSLSPKRAEMIAVTEVTNAYAAGSAEGARALEVQGWTLAKTWHTNRDDLVCALCRELDSASVIGVDAEFEDGSVLPPRHPRCRCWLTYSVVLAEAG